MSSAKSDNSEGKYSQLCSRCYMEINPTLIESDDDTKPLLSGKSHTGDDLLFVSSRKRKRVIDLTDVAKHEVDETRVEDQVAHIFSPDTHMDEDVNTLDDDKEATNDGSNETDFPGMSYKQVSLMLQEQICGSVLSKKEKASMLAALMFLREKHSPKKVAKSNRSHPQPGDEIECLLRGLGKDPDDIKRRENMGKILEENMHPWSTSKIESDIVGLNQDIPPAPKIFMRVWDDMSQARIRDGNEGFLSGCNYMPLHETSQRKAAIEKHASWRNRTNTAFISTTTDIKDLVTYMIPHLERRQRKKGLSSITKITLINGNVSGMPILPIRRELNHYKCDNPYGESSASWYDTEHLFLFRITREQIVNTWRWKDVEQWLTDNNTEDIQRWYQEVLIPAYNIHEQNRMSGSLESKHAPNCTCCGH